jgi:hypothetical protein
VAPSAIVVSIYRARNAGVLATMLEPAQRAGWEIRLWALDEPDARLAPLTRGSGAGTKFELLNELLAADPPPEDAWLFVADDDVVFGERGLVDFGATAERAGFGLAQPAHRLRSNISHRITWARPLSRARLTTFVEIGPVFAVAPGWRSRVAPFPEGIGMGWGLELEWTKLRDDGCRLGIVDEARMTHLSPVAEGYGFQAEAEKLARLLEERGVPRWRGVRNTLATWRPWQRTPPWLRGAG